MANGLVQARPGDLITSQGFNDLLAKIDSLEQRILTLEAGSLGSGIIITSFDPVNQQSVGQELRLFGSGFLFPPQLNIVRVDGVVVPEFRAGSTSSQLRFLVPPLTGTIPALGRVIVIRVENANGFTQRSYRILPEVPAVGDPPIIDSVRRTNNSTTLVIGQTAVITGSNFGATAPENQISFIVDLGGGGTHEYPEPGDSLAIISTSETEIRLTVPDMVEVPAVGSLSMTLELTVGSHPSATRTIPVRR